MKNECKKRRIEVKQNANIGDLTTLLMENDKRPPDWGYIYGRILYHTGMVYEEISRRTIPQIMAILDGAEENISIKLGIPSMFGGVSSAPSGLADEPPKLSQFAAFASAFDKI